MELIREDVQKAVQDAFAYLDAVREMEVGGSAVAFHAFVRSHRAHKTAEPAKVYVEGALA